MSLGPKRTPPPGRSSTVFTVSETPSTAIDPLGARNGASSAPASISTRCESPSGATAAILPTPSTWPVTMAAKFVAHFQRALKVQPPSDGPLALSGAAHGFGRNIDGTPALVQIGRAHV